MPSSDASVGMWATDCGRNRRTQVPGFLVHLVLLRLSDEPNLIEIGLPIASLQTGEVAENRTSNSSVLEKAHSPHRVLYPHHSMHGSARRCYGRGRLRFPMGTSDF
jgi:hypothetical protein